MTAEPPTADLVAGCTQRGYLYLARDLDPVGPPYDSHALDLLAFDPDEVTRLIGLRPTTSWRRGDPGPPQPRRFSEWKYELPEVRTFITEDVVVPLLDAIEPYAEGIAAACRTLGLRAGVMVVIQTIGERDDDDGIVVSTPAVDYSAATVQRLSRLRLSIHHDQYVALPDP